MQVSQIKHTSLKLNIESENRTAMLMHHPVLLDTTKKFDAKEGERSVRDFLGIPDNFQSMSGTSPKTHSSNTLS